MNSSTDSGTFVQLGIASAHFIRDVQGHVADHPPRATTLRRSYGTALHLRNSRNETPRQSFFAFREMPMTSQAIEGACAFAWRNYLLLHTDIRENDNRRSALYRYIANLRDTGEYDFDLLQIAAVAYLKKLENCMTTEVRDSR
jgi:hypothetical protein